MANTSRKKFTLRRTVVTDYEVAAETEEEAQEKLQIRFEAEDRASQKIDIVTAVQVGDRIEDEVDLIGWEELK